MRRLYFLLGIVFLPFGVAALVFIFQDNIVSFGTAIMKLVEGFYSSPFYVHVWVAALFSCFVLSIYALNKMDNIDFVLPQLFVFIFILAIFVGSLVSDDYDGKMFLAFFAIISFLIFYGFNLFICLNYLSKERDENVLCDQKDRSNDW